MNTLMGGLVLEPNVIYATLFTIDPGKDWHWAIYLHHPHQHHTGYQMDVTNEPGISAYRRFSTSFFSPSSASTSPPIALCKIGRIDEEDWDIQYLEYYLEAVPLDGTGSSKAWFGRAVRALDDTGFFLRCDDVDALRCELVGFAKAAEEKGEAVVLNSNYATPVSSE